MFFTIKKLDLDGTSQALLRAGAGACAPLRVCVLPCARARASQVALTCTPEVVGAPAGKSLK